MMYFEGPEKKLEVTLSIDTPSLRNDGNLWERVVEASRAKILSKISTDRFDAYLLSESSLFVFDHKFIMITCGTTTLISGILEFITNRPKESIDALFYERKNELFPHSQSTSFYDDAKLLNNYLPGTALRFGDEDEHHIYLFHLNKTYSPPSGDKTLEFLMHNVKKDACELFSSQNSLEKIREVTSLKEFFPGFIIDDYFFEPNGYSLNACKGNSYFTIHVTPQKIGSYISFETNYYMTDDVERPLNQLLELFSPSSCDLFLFQDQGFQGLNNNNYLLKKDIHERLSCGYDVYYRNYFDKRQKKSKSFKLSLK